MSHKKIYDLPELYARGASFKRIKLESESLLKICQLLGKGKPMRSLELFAGPAFNSKYLAQQGVEAHCVDSNAKMQKFALSGSSVAINYLKADVKSFKINKKFDLIFSLFDSVTYLLTNEDFVEHLRTVASHLRPGGLYVMEIGHPKIYFSKVGWIFHHHHRNQKNVLSMKWGDANDRLDPINMVINCTVSIETKIGKRIKKISETALQRIYFYNELKLLVAQVKSLEIAHWYGGLSPLRKFDSSPEAKAMVLVLRKR